MSDEVYTQLREFLDKMPGGYPATDTGVEIKILKKFFTPEQAELTLLMTPMPEPVAAIAERTGRDEAELADKLEAMAKEGILLRVRDGEQAFYMAASFVVGIFEFHLNSLDKEVSEYLQEYFPHMAKAWEGVRTKQLRVVPVESSVDADRAVGSYDRIREIVKDKQLISVGPCICAKEHELLGSSCTRPIERCIQFDMAAQYYIENGMSREISHDELTALLKSCEENGLVPCPTNAKEIINMCMCCDCCCNFLKVLKSYERPADHIQSPVQASIDPDACILCGQCEEMCQMEAIREKDGTNEVDEARCIGCGLCVPVCPEEAISFVDKPEVSTVPENIIEMNIQIATERGVL